MVEVYTDRPLGNEFNDLKVTRMGIVKKKKK